MVIGPLRADMARMAPASIGYPPLTEVAAQEPSLRRGYLCPVTQQNIWLSSNLSSSLKRFRIYKALKKRAMFEKGFLVILVKFYLSLMLLYSPYLLFVSNMLRSTSLNHHLAGEIKWSTIFQM